MLSYYFFPYILFSLCVSSSLCNSCYILSNCSINLNLQSLYFVSHSHHRVGQEGLDQARQRQPCFGHLHFQGRHQGGGRWRGRQEEICTLRLVCVFVFHILLAWLFWLGYLVVRYYVCCSIAALPSAGRL